MPGQDAIRKAREAHPEEYEAYQSQSSMDATGPQHRVTKSAAVVTFEGLIDRVQKRDECARIDALQSAALEYPDELEAYQTA